MPREGYNLSMKEKAEKRAISGSKAWRYTKLEMKEIPVPDIKDDELLIKIGACGICGSDAHLYEMDDEGYILFSGAVKLPCIVGHEYSGEVVETGEDVSDFKKGDIVTGESILWCGKCLPCRYGMLNQCENIELMGLTSNGAFAEYVAVKAKYCWKLNGLDSVFDRDDIFSVGALIEPLGCAYNGIFVSGGGFHPGANAVVYGAGPIGLAAVALLRAAGAGVIIALDIIDERLELAKKLGADYTFNSDKTPYIEKVMLDITQGWGADLQIEAAGSAGKTMPLIQRLYAKRGRVIYLGRADALATMDLNSIVSGANSITGSRGHSGYGIFPNIIRLLTGGRLKGIKEMITSVFPFSEVITAFEKSKERKDGKILISFNRSV